MKILITSGGTTVPIDRVRYIANMATGKFGLSLAAEFHKATHQVTVLHSENGAQYRSVAPVLPDSSIVRYTTFDTYRDTLLRLLSIKPYDLVISAAAVSDYEVVRENNTGKISGNENVTLTLRPLPKVISEIKKIQPKCKLVGFKLLVGASEDEIANAVNKQFKSSDSDIVAFNDLNSKERKYRLFGKTGQVLEIGGDQLARSFAGAAMQMLYGNGGSNCI